MTLNKNATHDAESLLKDQIETEPKQVQVCTVNWDKNDSDS